MSSERTVSWVRECHENVEAFWYRVSHLAGPAKQKSRVLHARDRKEASAPELGTTAQSVGTTGPQAIPFPRDPALRDQGLFMLFLDTLDISGGSYLRPSFLGWFLFPKVQSIMKCRKWHFLHGIYLKRKGKDCNHRSCCCPLAESTALFVSPRAFSGTVVDIDFSVPTRKKELATDCLCTLGLNPSPHFQLCWLVFSFRN